MEPRTSDSTPFYKQLKNKILDEIESGKLSSGDKLPSERELADLYGISRMTARHALSILEREGVVERRVGSGTFVTNKKIEMDFITFNSFTKNMLGKGLRPNTQLLSVRKDLAKPSLARKLKVPEGEEVIVFRRLRLVDGTPVAIEESFLPYGYCPGIEEHIADDTSLYQVLEDVYQIVLVKAREYMQVTFSDEAESKLLRIKPESPCILLEAVAYDKKGREIEFSKSITRSDIVRYYSELHLK